MKPKPAYVLGWKYGGDGYQLYLQRRESEHRVIRSGSEAIIIAGRVEVLRVDSRL